MASKGRRYKTVVVEGYEVLIGKGDADNDELTFALAAPEDFWLHVAGGVPGSHVVIRNPDKLDALPRAVVERAAELAARHSKALGSGALLAAWMRGECRAAWFQELVAGLLLANGAAAEVFAR